MTQSVDLLVKVLVWLIAILILISYFNPWGFYCSHTLSWQYFFSLCSLTSLIEGFIALGFISISINTNAYRISCYLVFIVLMMIASEGIRGAGLDFKVIAYYSWKLLAIVVAFMLFKNSFNWHKNSLVLLLFFMILGYLCEEIDFDFIRYCLLMTVFLILAIFIKRFRSSALKSV